MDTNDDIDMDEIMDMIGTMPEESIADVMQDAGDSRHVGLVPEKEEPYVQQEPEVKAPAKESQDSKLYFEAVNANLKMKQELDALKIAKAEAEAAAVKGAISNFESQINSAHSENERLKHMLLRARDEGDNATSIEVESRLRENQDTIRDLKGKIERYAPLLETPAPVAQRQDAGSDLASQWVRDNESWLKDPDSSAKRAYADKLFADLQGANGDMNSLGFWTKMEKGLADFESSRKQAEEKPQHRMPKNMVTYNSNGSSAPAKKTGYKDNPQFIQQVAHLVKNVIKNDDVLSNQKLLNSTLKHYYKVYKEGGFKHLPTTLN